VCELYSIHGYIDMYDPPSCWTVIPSSTSSSVIYAAYGDRIYMIDNITCKEKVIYLCSVFVQCAICVWCLCVVYFKVVYRNLGSSQ